MNNKLGRNKSFSLCAFPKNRRGWIEIVEAFIAVLLIASVVLIIITKQSTNEDISEKIYDIEISILREIQTNDSLRGEIASVTEMPLSWSAEGFPIGVHNKIEERTPSYLECAASICVMNTPCLLGDVPASENKNIYSQSTVISSIVGEGIGFGASGIAISSGEIITGVTISDGGTGYGSGSTVTIIGDGTGATGTVATNSEGEITGVTIVNGGTGYSNGGTVTLGSVYKQINIFCWTI